MRRTYVRAAVRPMVVDRARREAKKRQLSLSAYIDYALDLFMRKNFFNGEEDDDDAKSFDELKKMVGEARAESVAGLTTVCRTKEESDQHLRRLKEEADRELSEELGR